MKNSTSAFFLFIALAFAGCNGQKTNDPPTTVIVKHHNKIDDLTSVKEIEKFIQLTDTDYVEFKVNDSLKFNKECQHFCDSLKIKPWVKEDFDSNGYTDILIVGYWYSNPSIICIMDSGENRCQIKNITRRSFQDCTFPIIEKIGQTPVIMYYSKYETRHEYLEKGPLKKDTLIFQSGDFVEFNAKPANHKIEKIEYSTTGCYGTCPVFELTINKERNATFNAEQYNKKEGKFSGNIDTASYNRLTFLLNYIDFEKLDTAYSVNWTDDQGCTLKITYDNGKVKKIEDYGLLGTFGLNRTYDLLLKLTEDQAWK